MKYISSFSIFILSSLLLNSQNSIDNLIFNQEANNALRFDIGFETQEESKAFVEFYYLENTDTIRYFTNITETNSIHSLKLLGLKTNTNYRFQVSAFNESGMIKNDWLEINTGDIPTDISLLDSLFINTDAGVEGYILSNAITNGTNNPGVAQIFDRKGNVVWYDYVPGEISSQRCQQFTYSKDQTIVYTDCHRIVEQSLDGTIITDIDLSAYDSLYLHHDAFKNQNGNFVSIYSNTRIIDKSSVGGPVDALVVGQGFIEVSRDGELIQQWSCFDHYDPLESPEPGGYWTSVFGQESINWLHANAMMQDIDGHYIMSFRFASHLIKIHKNNGLILWTLGENGNLEFDSSENIFNGQHSITLTPEGNYMLFDNQGKDSLSRALEFFIDDEYLTPVSMKVWEYVLPPELFTPIVSSSFRLENGNALICSGQGKTILELNPENEIIWSARQSSRMYRAYYVNDFYNRPEPIELQFDPDEIICLNDSIVNLMASPLGGYFTGPGIVNNQFDPSAAGTGTHAVSYQYANQKIEFTLNVDNSGVCNTAINAADPISFMSFPNPVKDKICIKYFLESDSSVEISLYNLQGQLIQTFMKSQQSQGRKYYEFKVDELGISSGQYLISVDTDYGAARKKIVIL